MINDLINKPYANGGRGPDSFDCWGLAREVYSRHGIDIPDYSISADSCSEITGAINTAVGVGQWSRIKKPIVPCVVLIRVHPQFTHHIGVFIGAGKFIHVRDYVMVERLDSPIWSCRIKGFWKYARQD